MEAREKAGKPCDMCNNYEAQLQNIQDDYKREQVKAKSLERRLNHELQTLENKQKYIRDLENSLNNSATEAQNQVSVGGWGEGIKWSIEKSLQLSSFAPSWMHPDNEIYDRYSNMKIVLIWWNGWK